MRRVASAPATLTLLAVVQDLQIDTVVHAPMFKSSNCLSQLPRSFASYRHLEDAPPTAIDGGGSTTRGGGGWRGAAAYLDDATRALGACLATPPDVDGDPVESISERVRRRRLLFLQQQCSQGQGLARSDEQRLEAFARLRRIVRRRRSRKGGGTGTGTTGTTGTGAGAGTGAGEGDASASAGTSTSMSMSVDMSIDMSMSMSVDEG